MISRGIDNSTDLGASATDVSDTFQRQGVIGLVAAAVFALAAYFATRSIKEIGNVRAEL